MSINGEGLGDLSGTKQNGRASLMRLFKLGRPEYPLLGAGMCALAVTSTSSISAPYFFGKVIDAATKNNMEDLNRHVYIREGAPRSGPNMLAGRRFSNPPAWICASLLQRSQI